MLKTQQKDIKILLYPRNKQENYCKAQKMHKNMINKNF